MAQQRGAHTLAAEDLSLAYGDHRVVDRLTLPIPTGAVTVVVGANACGKSTLLRGLARLMSPTHGAVLLDGRAIHQQPTRAVATLLGLLPQTPVAPEGTTVTDLVGRGRYPHQGWFRRWTDDDEQAVAAALQATDVVDLAERPVDELSGGQRQRVWIAMALAQQTDILLLDEPTTFLDVAHQVEVLDLLADLNRERGTTVVMVLHDLNLAARYADHLVAHAAGWSPPACRTRWSPRRSCVRCSPWSRGSSRTRSPAPLSSYPSGGTPPYALEPPHDRHRRGKPDPLLRRGGGPAAAAVALLRPDHLRRRAPGRLRRRRRAGASRPADQGDRPLGRWVGRSHRRLLAGLVPALARPRPGGARRDAHLHGATGSTRRRRPQVDIDFVLHVAGDGTSGPAAAWASAAQLGDRVVLMGPRRGRCDDYGGIEWAPPAPHDGPLLLAGDETAVPAVASILETLPSSYVGWAFLEVPAAVDFLQLHSDADVEVTWLARGHHPRGSRLASAVHEAAAPYAREPQDDVPDVDPDTMILWETPGGRQVAGTPYVWVAGEAAVVRALRRHLVAEVGLPRANVAFMGYWREGRTL